MVGKIFVCSLKNQLEGKLTEYNYILLYIYIKLYIIIFGEFRDYVENVIFEYTFKIKDNILPFQVSLEDRISRNMFMMYGDGYCLKS